MSDEPTEEIPVPIQDENPPHGANTEAEMDGDDN